MYLEDLRDGKLYLKEDVIQAEEPEGAQDDIHLR